MPLIHDSHSSMKQLPQSNEPFQVYLFTCPAHKPFHFARHPWVVIVKDNNIYRYEITHKKDASKKHFGFVHVNYFDDPCTGIGKKHGSQEKWESTLIGSVTGKSGSLAERMVDFIETYSPDYLHKDRYILYPGPNSNTYIAWILNKFPEANITLPWNCFGKKYLK